MRASLSIFTEKLKIQAKDRREDAFEKVTKDFLTLTPVPSKTPKR